MLSLSPIIFYCFSKQLALKHLISQSLLTKKMVHSQKFPLEQVASTFQPFIFNKLINLFTSDNALLISLQILELYV